MLVVRTSRRAIAFYAAGAVAGLLCLVCGAVGIAVVCMAEKGISLVAPCIAGGALILFGGYLCALFAYRAAVVARAPQTLLTCADGKLVFRGGERPIGEIKAVSCMREAMRIALLDWGTLTLETEETTLRFDHVAQVVQVCLQLRAMIKSGEEDG